MENLHGLTRWDKGSLEFDGTVNLDWIALRCVDKGQRSNGTRFEGRLTAHEAGCVLAGRFIASEVLRGIARVLFSFLALISFLAVIGSIVDILDHNYDGIDVLKRFVGLGVWLGGIYLISLVFVWNGSASSDEVDKIKIALQKSLNVGLP